MTTVKPFKAKTARTKRIMQKREPQVHEGPKVAMFLKGSTSSALLNEAMNDLVSRGDGVRVK